MFNVRRNRESKEQKAVSTESVPALDVETGQESVVENRQMSEENVSLLRREDMQQPSRPGQGGALLGRGCRFDGKLTFEGTVQIDGEFIGSIDSPGHLIVSDAMIEGTINVASAIISGTVKGKITTTGTAGIALDGQGRRRARCRVARHRARRTFRRCEDEGYCLGAASF